MYNESVVERHLRAVSKTLKVKLKRTPIGKAEDWCAHLSALLKDGKLKRPLKAEERAHIQNERLLSKFDFRYWAERYSTLALDGSVGLGVGRFHPWESQERTLTLIARIEEENFAAFEEGSPCDGICIVQHKARQLGACLGAGTRLLTADLRWVPIEDVKAGDQLVSSDDEIPHRQGQGRKMRLTTVLSTCSMLVPTCLVTLDDGTRFVATPHHKFLCVKCRGETSRHYVWREVRDMKAGDKIRRMVRPWDATSTYEDGWFGGIIDGEGSMGSKSRSGADLCVSQVAGPVLDRASAYLRNNGYKYRVEVDNRKAGAGSKLGNKPVYKLCVSRMVDIFKLLGKTRSTRFVGKSWYEGKELPNGELWGKVVSVDGFLSLPVYDIQTTTGTYIAEGFVSHNTAISRLLMMHRATLWEYTRAMAASVDEPKVHDQLYSRDKVCYDNLPWFLRPRIKFDVKDKHLAFDGIHSAIMYQQSNQESGLGQGSQFDISHLTEVASWQNPAVIRYDFIPTIPQSPFAFCILESTANGRGNWWHTFTEEVRRREHRRWHYCFWPWYVNARKYRAKPPPTWKPSELTLLHAKKVYDTSREWVGHDVLLPQEQLYWYESERASAKRLGELNLFLTNYATTPEESFQHSTLSAFSTELLEEFRLQTTMGKSYEFRAEVSQ